MEALDQEKKVVDKVCHQMKLGHTVSGDSGSYGRTRTYPGALLSEGWKSWGASAWTASQEGQGDNHSLGKTPGQGTQVLSVIAGLEVVSCGHKNQSGGPESTVCWLDTAFSYILFDSHKVSILKAVI